MRLVAPSYQFLPEILHRVIQDGGGPAPAIFYNDEVWSFDDLVERSRQLGSKAASLSEPGDRIAILGANHPDWISAYYGIPEYGRVLCFLNYRLSPVEIIEQINRSEAKVLIARREDIERLQQDVASLQGSFEIIYFGEPLDEKIAPPDAVLNPEDPAWILFTSGTTGKPKGVLLSHENLFAAISASENARPVSDRDVYAFPFPLCHVAGYSVLRNQSFGRPVVIFDRYDPREFVELVERHQINATVMAATMLASLMHHLENQPRDVLRLSSLKKLNYGAAPMPATLLRSSYDLLHVEFSQGFGMTELAGNALFLDAHDHQVGFDKDATLLSATGRPGPGVEARLLDSQGNDVPLGEPGELTIRSAQVTQGYLDDEVGTEATLVEGWLKTGDLAVERPDGIYQIVDRLKDVIVTGGENVSSLEVENALRAHCPEIRDVAVIGTPDSVWGENVCAVVILNEEASLSIDEIAQRLTGTLANFKIPRHLIMTDEFPLTHSGKVEKSGLRSWITTTPEALGQRRGGG